MVRASFTPFRLTPILMAALLGACAPWQTPVVAIAAADTASIMVFQRGLSDLFISGVSGRDCSVVRLDRGQTYCRPIEAPPDPPPYCTRSLGNVDCWASPILPTNPARGVADGPRALTPRQDANRTKSWPSLFY